MLNKSKRLVVIAAAAASVTAAALWGAFVWTRAAIAPAITQAAAIGGSFSLVNQKGARVTEQDYLGKPMLVYFGYTYCPDVCPTTLLDLSSRLHELGSDADRLNVLFITVDPERDTPAILADYLSSFDPHITGLSGSRAEIDAVIKKYRVYARKVPVADGFYVMDHTSLVYMMDARGRFVDTIKYQEDTNEMRAKLRRLIGAKTS